MIPTGNSQLMKRINRSLLLQAIWADGPVSRAELAKEMRLSPATVSVIIDQLLKDGLITEHGIGESQGGRPPILLTFRPESRLVVAVSVTVQGVHAALMDLDATVLKHIQRPIDLTHGAAMVASIRFTIQELLSPQMQQGPPILGIGIACPGLIDSDRGVLRYSSSLGQSHVGIAEAIEAALGLPVLLDNDQNAAALSEMQYGAGRGYSNLIYVSIEAGIGTGVVIDGRLYRGAGGGAGEFGHITLDVNGPQCKCGNRGCLGVLAGGAAMVSHAVRLVQQRADTILIAYCSGDIRRLSLEHVIDAARAGDRMASGIFDEAMNYLGAGIANLINLFAPELIILGGSVTREAGDMLLEAVRSSVVQRALPVHRNNVRIVPASGGTQNGLIGAGLLVIQDFRMADAFAG